jgi:hypothetical protein
VIAGCPSVRLSIYILSYTFSTSSPEPLSQFQLDFAQIILGVRGFKFIEMKIIALPQGEIIAKKKKCTENFQKFSSPEPLAKFNQTWYKLSLGRENSSLFK